MSNQSYRSLLKAKNRSGSAPWLVFNVEEHVDIGFFPTVWSRLRLPWEAGGDCRTQAGD